MTSDEIIQNRISNPVRRAEQLIRGDTISADKQR